MPEPLLFLKATAAAAVSAVLVLVLAWRRPASAARLNTACLLAGGLGLIVGYYTLSLPSVWPPASGLDRFLAIVLPAALIIESIAGFPRVPHAVAWFFRIGFAATIPRILLHGSTYLSGTGDDWPLWQAYVAQAVGGAFLAGMWVLLYWLSRRSGGVAIPLALCLTIQAAGLAIMMAGYIKGGAAAFPLVATLATIAIACNLIIKWSDAPSNFVAPATLGIGVVGLFCLLFIVRFFGRLSTGCVLTLLLTPLLCWATEIPLLGRLTPWIVGLLQLVLVAIPLAVVLSAAKLEFDRDIAPLLP